MDSGKKVESSSKPRDWLSTTFSAVALSVSLLSLYFSTFYISNDTRARIVKSGFHYNGSGQQQGFEIDVAVANAGNRPSIVSAIGFVIGDSEEAPDLQWSIPGSELPVLIPAHDLRLIRLIVPVQDAVAFKLRLTKIKNRQMGDQFVFLDFNTIDASGQLTRYISPALFGARVSEGRMQSGMVLVSKTDDVFLLNTKNQGSRQRAEAMQAAENANLQ